MQLKTLWTAICIWVMLSFALPLICSGEASLSNQIFQSDFPPLMESIQFKNDIKILWC